MKKQCTECSAHFEISEQYAHAVKKISFRLGENEIELPLPTECPECRMLLRTCHRNERNLYKGTSDLSQKPIVTLYGKTALWGKPYTIYHHDEWNSDQLDAMTYGRDFDDSRPFFDQFADLHKDVPRMNVVAIGNENCDYSTSNGYCKNCYLINSSENCEDCYYGKLLQSCSDCIDCSYLYNSQLCYECYSLYNSYNCKYTYFSQNCTDCYFSYNLQGCKDCFLCINLHQKQYCIENEQYSKEEYFEKIHAYKGSYKKVQEAVQQMKAMRLAHPVRFANIINSEYCSGDYIEHSKNCRDCYDINNSEDCYYVQTAVEVKDNIDCSNMYLGVEKCFYVLGTIECVNCAYCIFTFHSQDLLYCEQCRNCRHCFGCTGIDNKSYCILNKQYSKEEYESLVPMIIEHMKTHGEWGHFLPPKYSPFGYNETLAYEYKPLTKQEALDRGFYWRDDIDQKPNVEKSINASTLPDTIAEIPDDICNWAIVCEKSGRPFQIIKRELEFYRKHSIPIPHLHPDERHKKRMEIRSDRKLYDRECNKCNKSIQSPYGEERPEIVYCEECYLNEVY